MALHPPFLAQKYTFCTLYSCRKYRVSDEKIIASLVGTGLPDGPLKRYKPLLRTVEDAGPYENRHSKQKHTLVLRKDKCGFEKGSKICFTAVRYNISKKKGENDAIFQM